MGAGGALCECESGWRRVRGHVRVEECASTRCDALLTEESGSGSATGAFRLLAR